ncbi:spore coat protein [Bacillus luteolus]|uniref:Spore coat protein n=1 Tax=Litchfieldia luteola TaxID=682179 RepID=A0ABR9QED6_9BACI|nr:spore coat protein [Cytobacillus luteolus]MBE4906857.1 spore coat protein [Cytobacillus luteolus]MBP1940488.1 spore coat protein CotF [Cytobacillus luteolus]
MEREIGAHELLKIHEVMQKLKDGMNLYNLYLPHIKNEDFARLVEYQLHFTKSECKMFLDELCSPTANVCTYGMYTIFEPTYGYKSITLGSDNKFSEHEISSSLLAHCKSTAIVKMSAALECANPDLRQLMVQSSTNSVHQAYDIWRFMNAQGYYQVPVFPEETTEVIIQSFKKMYP